ncbi:MAG: tyrosine-type recombinase/integrase [Sedimenticola sp.]
MEFLTQLFSRGLTHSAIGTARSAISSFTKICGNVDIGADILVRRFMRGIFLKRPSLPKYSHTWDVNLVLNYLTGLNDVTLLQLSSKLCILFLLLSAQRCQTLHLIRLEDISFSRESLTIKAAHLLKQSRPGRHVADMVFTSYTKNDKLCLVKTMRAYMDRTRRLRGTESRLLISSQHPHKGVSKDTVGRWVKSVMHASGVDKGFGPHSTRSAATSRAKTKGVTLDIIMSTAGWANAKTFAKFYDKPVQTQLGVQAAVLGVD